MDSAKDQRGKRLRAGVYLLVAGVFARVAGDATGALAAPSAEEPGAVITALAPLLADAEFIRAFYARRGMRPVWTRENQIRALVELIEGAFDEGLDPRDYHHDRVRELLAGEERSAELDVLATDALVRLSYHLRFGKVNPRRLYQSWNYSRTLGALDPFAALQAAIDAPSLREYMEPFVPRLRPYQELKRALRRLREWERTGGWPGVATGPTLKPGMTDTRVPQLRASLAARGLLRGASDGGALYDTALEQAVLQFQKAHGLAADGLAGKATLAALNVPVAARIDQVRANLERARWVFRDLEPDFLAVNIAGFEAYLVRGGRVVWRGRTVVGRTYRRTPVFKAEIERLELNPTWTVPPVIFANDILPKLRKDPGYLARMHMRVLDRAGRAVDAADVDWPNVSARGFPYQLRQDPGADNALGRVKFIFPNPYSVFVHDTPSQQLFECAERTLSSGCIRVERALQLAQALLDDPANWSRAKIDEVVASGKTQAVPLPKPLTIMLLYWTVSFDDNWNPIFLNDVYGRDRGVIAALKGPFALDPPSR